MLGNDYETNKQTTIIAVQRIHNLAVLLEELLGSGPHASMEVLLEAVFSVGPLQYYITSPTEIS
jgi:hypothetical protein